MSNARKTSFRSACLLGAAATAFVLGSAGVAQERDSRLTLAAAVGQPAPPPVLNPRHPDHYVVKPGDTLWDIAAMFLRDPWNWPEIWQVNPQIANPHLIYPGDTLSLAYLDDGRPVVQVERGPAGSAASSGNVERLSPRIREEPLEQPISTIPYETLAAFLKHPAVLAKKDLDRLPYVVAQREGLIGSSGRDMYVRQASAPVGSAYNVVHLGDKLVDPDDNTVLGYQGVYVGQARVAREGDPATVHLLETNREALAGDYLIEAQAIAPFTYQPHPPAKNVEGRIISVLDGVSLIGQYQVVVLNRGSSAGLEPGNVLRVYRTGQVIRDNARKHRMFGEKVRLPDEPAGTMMVFQTFDRMSYALVMEATDAISVLDTVRNP